MPNEILIYLYLAGCFTVLFLVVDYVVSEEYTLQDVFSDVLFGIFWPMVLVIVFGMIISNPSSIVIKKRKKDRK